LARLDSVEMLAHVGFQNVLSPAQHWSVFYHWIDNFQWPRLIVSKQVCAFISSRDMLNFNCFILDSIFHNVILNVNVFGNAT
jgi:hypothetical protein